MNSEPLDPLSERELEVLRLLAEGLSNREIAQRLTLSLETIKWYNRQIYSKLGVRGRTQAAASARELGLLESEEPPAPAIEAPQPPTIPSPEGSGRPPAFLTDQTEETASRAHFVGRERELAILENRLKQALSGQGRVVFVTGEAGQGKTTLLRAFAHEAQAAHPDLVTATGACPLYTPVSAPYAIFREVLEMLSGDVEPAWIAGAVSREQALRLWRLLPEMVGILLQYGRNLLGSLVMVEGLIQRAILASVEPQQLKWLNEILAQGTANGSRLTDQGELFAEYVAVLRALATRRPLLLVLDDLHWADPASIGLLSHLGHRLEELNILLVGAYRAEEVDQGRGGESHPLVTVLSEYQRRFGDVRLSLDEAAPDSGRFFVDALLDAEPNALGEEFRRGLVQHTGGHPMFTVELLREMQGRGALQRDERDRWVVRPEFTWDVMPPRVEGVIETRIKRLEPELHDWLTVASVEGEIFTVEVLARVQGTSKRTIVKRLSGELDKQHHLVKARGLRRSGNLRLSRYLFRHNLFRQYLYDQLDEIEGSYLHEQVGDALEQLFEGQSGEIADQLAHHYQLAGNDDKAFRYLVQAAKDAAGLYAYDEALTFYTGAIKAAERLAQEVPVLVDLYLKRASAYETMGAFDRSRADDEKAMQMAQTAGLHQFEWRALLALGKLWASRDYNKAGEYFEQALGLAHRAGDPVMVARSLNRRGNWYANTNHLPEAIEDHKEAYEIFQEQQDQRGMANTLDLLGMANFFRGDLVASAEYYDRAISLFRELDNQTGLASCLANRVAPGAYYEYHMAVLTGSLEETLSFMQEALQIAQEIGWRSQEAYALWGLGTRWFVLGQFGQALEAMERGFDIAAEIGHRQWMAAVLIDLGRMYCGLFSPGKAQRHLKQALDLAREIGSPHWINLVNGTLANTALLQGDPAASQAYLEAVIAPDSPMDTVSERYCWAWWAELAIAQGESAGALDIVDRLIASIPGLMPDRIISSLWRLRGKALADVGRLDEAEFILQVALENAMALDEHFLLWRLHASLGWLYQEKNHRTEADNEFEIAQKLTEELAATIPEGTLKDNFLEGVSSLLETTK